MAEDNSVRTNRHQLRQSRLQDCLFRWYEAFHTPIRIHSGRRAVEFHTDEQCIGFADVGNIVVLTERGANRLQ
jgi:hypothetical protein